MNNFVTNRAVRVCDFGRWNYGCQISRASNGRRIRNVCQKDPLFYHITKKLFIKGAYKICHSCIVTQRIKKNKTNWISAKSQHSLLLIGFPWERGYGTFNIINCLIYSLCNPHVASILFNSIKNLKHYIQPPSKIVKTPQKNKQQPQSCCVLFYVVHVFTAYINTISTQADTTPNKLASCLVITPASCAPTMIQRYHARTLLHMSVVRSTLATLASLLS